LDAKPVFHDDMTKETLSSGYHGRESLTRYFQQPSFNSGWGTYLEMNGILSPIFAVKE
jgi:hypothetical protein